MSVNNSNFYQVGDVVAIDGVLGIIAKVHLDNITYTVYTNIVDAVVAERDLVPALTTRKDMA